MSGSLFRAGGRISSPPRPMQYRNCNYRTPSLPIKYLIGPKNGFWFLSPVKDSHGGDRGRLAPPRSASPRSKWEERRRRGRRTGEATPSAVSHPTLELFQTNEQNEVALSLSSLINLVRGCVNSSMRVTQPPSRTNEVVCEVISRPPLGNGFI